MDEKKSPGWVVWSDTHITWPVVHNAGRKDEWIEIKERRDKLVLYSGQNIIMARYFCSLLKDTYPAIYVKRVEALPGFGTGRFV